MNEILKEEFLQFSKKVVDKKQALIDMNADDDESFILNPLDIKKIT